APGPDSPTGPSENGSPPPSGNDQTVARSTCGDDPRDEQFRRRSRRRTARPGAARLCGPRAYEGIPPGRGRGAGAARRGPRPVRARVRRPAQPVRQRLVGDVTLDLPTLPEPAIGRPI